MNTDTVSKRGNVLWAVLLMAALLAGCGTVAKTAIALTDVEASVMREWARAHNDNQTTEKLDRQVMAAHAEFKKLGAVAASALRIYQAGGPEGDYLKALEAARSAIAPLLDLIAPLIEPAKSSGLRNAVAIATKP